ncbi:Cytochrome P450 2L1 [Armadillidium nasatum]|uniref:Cytochrome P450 2L1 n=1 Tax=Armadillidium nasatum TaxID=96803 RepID=A0A5N5T9Z3_9CRUS|nr:Cytochrome P450 2L1 [Armadillidium nasatum]
MGKSKIEGIIMREVEDLVEDFKGLTKEPSKLPFSINVAVLNVIWQLVSNKFVLVLLIEERINLNFSSGHRYGFKDKQVEQFMKKINELQNDFMLIGLLDFFPILNYIVPKSLINIILGINKFDRATQEFQDLVKPFVDDHLKTLDPNNSRDLMDDYLIEMKEGKSEDFSHFSITGTVFNIQSLDISKFKRVC